jgi:hypothetical protein
MCNTHKHDVVVLMRIYIESVRDYRLLRHVGKCNITYFQMARCGCLHVLLPWNMLSFKHGICVEDKNLASNSNLLP